MKKPVLLASLLAAAAPASHAQQAPAGSRVASVGVFGLSANAGLQLEQRLGRHWSLGLQGARYFSPDFPGYQAALLTRYYFRPAAPAGLFLQAQVGLFSHDGREVSDYPGSSHTPYSLKVNGKGGALALGYQWPLTRHLLLNAALGVRVYPYRWGSYYCDCHTLGDFNALGQPGSVLDGQASLGYSF